MQQPGQGYPGPPPRTPCLSSLQRSGVHVLAFGRADVGQLGGTFGDHASSPVHVEALENKDVVHIAGSAFNTAFVTQDGELYTCGSNENGQLGSRPQAASEMRPAPGRVTALESHRVVHAACGQGHTVAVLDSGALAAFGAAEFGQLGHGGESTMQPLPRVVRGTPGMRFARVAAGACHTVALTSSGRVHACGQGTFGQLGLSGEENVDKPTEVRALSDVGVVQVACGENHSVALTSCGRIFTWGRGKYGQLGHGDFASSSTPAQVAALRGLPCCQIACGGDHTLALTRDGAVYAWGKGSSGQTGLGFTDNTCRPSRVQALAGKAVVQLAAGLSHSVALTADGEVWTFGSGQEGQLGLGHTHSEPSPRKVSGLPSLPVLFIAAGGDHTLVAVRDAQPGEAVPVGPHPSRPQGLAMAPLQPPRLLELLQATQVGGDGRPGALVELVRAVDDVFSCPGFLIAAFSTQHAASVTHSGAVTPTSAHPHHLDTDLLLRTYNALIQTYSPEVVAALGSATVRLLDALASPPAGGNISQVAALKALFIALCSPLNAESHGDPLVSRAAVLAASLDDLSRQLLAYWVAALPAEVIAARMVRPAHRLISKAVGGAEAGASGGSELLFSRNRPALLRVLQFLELLQDANEAGRQLLPYAEFYNEHLSNSCNLREEFQIWQHAGGVRSGGGLASICQVPFVLTPSAKASIIKGLSKERQQRESSRHALTAMLHGYHPAEAVFLKIRVRRSHILQDSLAQIVSRPEEFSKPLNVTFVSNGVDEEGQDQGGVSREWFQLLVAEIFKPDYGMFTYSEETRTFWFNPASFEASGEFQLVGIVLGLAIYNSVILDVHLPRVLYKKLLGQKPSFEDLKNTFPELGRGLQQLLEFEGDVEGVFCRTFEVEYEYYGALQKAELVPGGSNLPVTSSNRHKYVQAYSEWLLETSVARQFDAFARGFHMVVGGPQLKLLRHEELELLVCGLPHLDFADLEKGARYEAGYHAGHPTVRAFWAALHSLPLEAKKRFLAFTTGCDRAPVGGLKDLVLTIQRGGPDTDRLPTAHTCFNIMLLPEYSSPAKLKEKLLMAIENAQGFGLK